MFPHGRRSRTARAAVAGAAALLAAGIAACSTAAGSGGNPSPATASPTAAAAPGGDVRVALPSGVTLNWIWPFIPLTHANEYNTEEFEQLMYRPLYMFGDNGPSVSVNYPISVADAPVYSEGGKTVTITMKGWKWSDGETVDASDVIFWLNMMEAEDASYYGHGPGLLPDNLAAYRATGPDTVVLRLKSAVSSIWFTYNQLAEITPMPAAWDVAAAGAAPGSGGCAADSAADRWARCRAVFTFLTAQAKDVRTYATNPVWAVVDGPWRLSGFSTAPSGAVTSFVPNKDYSGSPRPELAGFTYYAYTDDAAEYTALKAGKIDVGYIPDQDLPPVSGGQLLPAADPLGGSFSLVPSYSYSVAYYQINFANPRIGPAFRQLYIRQALQETVDQEGMVAAIQRGYGYPTSGGVPNQPASQWVPSVQDQNGGEGPYSFSVPDATSLLTSHGWKDVGGVMTCATPSLCGAGVKAGTRLTITMDYAVGAAYFQQELSVLKSDAAQAGIQINLVPQSFNTVTGEDEACARPGCWEALDFGGWNFNGPGHEPTGEPLFLTGAASNAGSYSNPTEDNLINLTHTSNSLSVFQQYATYTAEQLPFIWMPDYYTVSAVSGRLADVGFSPLATLLPEYWYFTR